MILPQVHLRNVKSILVKRRTDHIKILFNLSTTCVWSVNRINDCWYSNETPATGKCCPATVQPDWCFKASYRLKKATYRALATSGTLLRLLLPLNDQVWPSFRLWVVVADLSEPVPRPHWAIQSVVATGGVYNIFLILLIGETGYTFNSLRKIGSLSSHSLWTIPDVQI